METIKYICEKCGDVGYAPTIRSIKQRKKICLKCMSEKNKENTKLNKNHYPSKKKIRTCKYCSKEFESVNARYCSKECRKKGTENTIFKNNLKTANSLISAQNVQVYGFEASKYDDNNFKKI